MPLITSTTNKTGLKCFFQVSVQCFREQAAFIASDDFRDEYGALYFVPKRLNQDVVESFFSVQRQLGGGNRNMTAHVYGYNINGILSYKCSNLVSHAQTNVNAIDDVARNLDALASNTLPKRSNCKGVFNNIEITLSLWR